MINQLPHSLIECATQILKSKKHPIAQVSFRHIEPFEGTNFVNEEFTGKDVNSWVSENENPENIDTQLKASHRQTDDDKTHVYRYTAASRPFNTFLYESHKKDEKPSKFNIVGRNNFTHDIRGLDAALHRNKLESPLVSYSGIGWNPHDRMDNEGVVHLPAYTSTTLAKSIAYNFAKSNKLDKDNPLHILRIKHHAGDSGFYTKDDPATTYYEGEREFIIPRNTKIKVNKVPTTYVDNGTPVHVWDAERIHTDPADTNYVTPHGNTELFNQGGLKLYRTDTLSALKQHYPDFHAKDHGSLFHESHVVSPVFHLHTPEGKVFQSKYDRDIDSLKFLPAAYGGKAIHADFVLNKYPQLNKFRELFYPKIKEDDDEY